jgi:mono/diheme cytochrome c family protein
VAIRFAAVSLTGGLLLLAAWPELRAAEPVSFSQQIRPILETSCWKCHGAAMQLSRLDLRTRETALKGGDHGPAIVPGNAGESRLFRLVSGTEKPAMPMDGTKLTDEQISAIKSWIEQGAAWDNAGAAPESLQAPVAIEETPISPEARKYWAFQKPLRRPAPQVQDVSWSRHPIDAFLMTA